MTETPATFASPRLERPADGGFKGVCTALARATSSDVILWRVLFVALLFFNGLGLVLYLAGMVFIPVEGEGRSVGHRLLAGPDRRLARNERFLVVAAVVVGLIFVFSRVGFVVLAVAAGLGFLWWRSERGEAHREALAPLPAPFAAPTDSTPPRPPRPPVRRSPLTGATLSLAVLTAGVLALIGTTGTSISAEVVLSAALAVVGLGLVAGAFFGRSTGLVVVALLLGLALALTAGVRPALDHGVGDRTWNPSASGSYELGIGDATLDLRGLAVSELQTYRIDARVDVGHLLVLVPAGVRASVDARATVGNVLVFGQEDDGRHAQKTVEPDGRPQVVLDLSVRTGQVEVRRG